MMMMIIIIIIIIIISTSVVNMVASNPRFGGSNSVEVDVFF